LKKKKQVRGNCIKRKPTLLKTIAKKHLNSIESYAVKSDVAQNMAAMFYRSTLYSFIKDKLRRFRDQKLLEQIKKTPVPNHIAIIMDGNRRFAQSVGFSPTIGHQFGTEKIKDTLDWCVELGIKSLTLYAFSTENFNRDKNEIEQLMDLCFNELSKAQNDSRIHKNKVRISVIGQIDVLPEHIQKESMALMDQTKFYDNYNLSIAISYGGREEIVNAIQKIAQDVEVGKLNLEDINEQKVTSYLYTKDLPDPDLILRTSGEERISNFLLWQMAYSEFYFTDVYWPAFQKRDFLKAVYSYQQRKRRYGT
jgi:tritrans,polycis-undecaprenyl-diphosphate synthase [geranylgeranyl-diphosphate specific]